MTYTDGEYSFMEGMERICGILDKVVEGLENIVDSLDTSDEELGELNAGKTEEEIDLEDKIAEELAVPLVNALDGMTAILNGATEKIIDMIVEDNDEEDHSFDDDLDYETEQP